MVEISSIYVLALAAPAAFYAATAFFFDERHKPFKILMWSWAYLMLLGTPVVGLSAAAEQGLKGIEKVMSAALLLGVSGFTLWIFYLYRTFIVNAEESMLGDSFDDDLPG
jgi:hypothetical protein